MRGHSRYHKCHGSNVQGIKLVHIHPFVLSVVVVVLHRHGNNRLGEDGLRASRFLSFRIVVWELWAGF
jgi:hypothetical protein